jgi:hypothetical protein
MGAAEKRLVQTIAVRMLPNIGSRRGEETS